MNVVTVHSERDTPKYLQIVESIENAIQNKELIKGSKLPSINAIKNKFNLSRDTVLTAFGVLKARGIVHSVAGKGYYVKSTDVNVSQKIFLLFDELNAFKEDLYNSFLESLHGNVQVDIFFHHFNFELFSKLIYDNVGNYSYYVIMPVNFKNTAEVLSNLPHDKVFILDQTNDELKKYPAVYQNFEADIYNSLRAAKKHISNYNKLILLFPETKQPLGMLTGFQKFKKEISITNEVIAGLDNRFPKKGEVYLILDDQNLIKLIKKIKMAGLKLGQDIGIISYNDTMLKEVVEDGITTISTDFKLMGRNLAKMIFSGEHKQIENPNYLIIRKSL
jgi:DNA-binding transcriptional regulator YhcF (GntR family)